MFRGRFLLQGLVEERSADLLLCTWNCALRCVQRNQSSNRQAHVLPGWRQRGTRQHGTGGVMGAGECAAARRGASRALARTVGMLASLAVLSLWGGGACAQGLPTYQVPSGAGDFGPFATGFGGNLALSSEEKAVFNTPVTTTANVLAYSTQVLGRLNGGTPLYDQTFAVPYSDPTAQAGVAAARAAITTAGGARRHHWCACTDGFEHDDNFRLIHDLQTGRNESGCPKRGDGRRAEHHHPDRDA